jgi:hypothetical protein
MIIEQEETVTSQRVTESGQDGEPELTQLDHTIATGIQPEQSNRTNLDGPCKQRHATLLQPQHKNPLHPLSPPGKTLRHRGAD